MLMKQRKNNRPSKQPKARKDFVSDEVNLADLPPLTEHQKRELAALSDRPDDVIDYSDNPALADGFWKNATRGRFHRPTKASPTALN